MSAYDELVRYLDGEVVEAVIFGPLGVGGPSTAATARRSVMPCTCGPIGGLFGSVSTTGQLIS